MDGLYCLCVHFFNKESARIAVLLRCITQPPVEPGAVGATRVNIERNPASAGNAVVLGQKKYRESTATLKFSPDIKLIEEIKQQMPAVAI